MWKPHCRPCGNGIINFSNDCENIEPVIEMPTATMRHAIIIGKDRDHHPVPMSWRKKRKQRGESKRKRKRQGSRHLCSSRHRIKSNNE